MATITVRCSFCKAVNSVTEKTCQFCGSWLGSLVCPRCSSVNPPENGYCGSCGGPLLGQGESEREKSAPSRRPGLALALVGLGSIVAVASVAYPWYVIGDSRGVPTFASLSQQMANGWSLFPGAPLLLIALSATLSTFLSLLASHGKAYPVPCILASLVSLLAALWLWNGLAGGGLWASDRELAPMLATVGAIILLVSAFLVARPEIGRTRP